MKKSIFFAMAMTLVLTMNAQTAVTLTIGNVDLTAGGKRAALKITSDVPVTDYCSYQFDLLLPEGVEMPWVEEESGYGYMYTNPDTEEEEFKPAYSGTITTGTHSFDVSAIEGGYRFICKSGQLTKFKADKTGVLTVQLIATSEAVNGTYPIQLGGIQKFSIADDGGAHSIVPSVVSGKCTVTGGVATKTIQYAMSSAQWGTLILPFDAALPQGLTAYSCSTSKVVAGENWLELTEAASIVANTPYLVNGTPGNYSFTGTPAFTQNSYTNGLFTGVFCATSISHGYVLQKQGDEVAFYKVPNGKSMTVPAYRCYLNDLPAGANAYRFGGTTNIAPLTEDDDDACIYDLMGRRVDGQMLTKGIYIRGNKKFYVQ